MMNRRQFYRRPSLRLRLLLPNCDAVQLDCKRNVPFIASDDLNTCLSIYGPIPVLEQLTTFTLENQPTAQAIFSPNRSTLY